MSRVKSSAPFCRHSRATVRPRVRPAVELLEDRVTPATITVNTLGDVGGHALPAVDLRDALTAANTGDTINFAPSLAGMTDTLTGGTLDQTFGSSDFLVSGKAITIDGSTAPGLVIARSAIAVAFRLFAVDATGSLTITSLELQNGVALGTVGASGIGPGSGSGGGPGRGGAIFVGQGVLVLNQCTIDGNQAVGGPGGSANYGGGVGMDFRGGDGTGGGIFNNGGSVTITNSTVTGNTAQGGSRNFLFPIFGRLSIGLGGGVYNRDGTLTITASTLSANTGVDGDGNAVVAGGRGVFNLGDSDHTRGDPVTSNTATATITNSIIGQADTVTEDFTGTSNGTGTNTATIAGDLIRTSSGTIIGSPVSTADPQLAALANNGGPTRTMAIPATSPAVGAGVPGTGVTIDQRGQLRTTPPDIGAVEFRVAPVITSGNTTSFIVGTAASFAVTATGSPVPTFALTGSLPAGLTFTPSTGVLAGTPAAGTAGTYSLTITATNSGGSATQSFFLTIVPANQGPAITSPASTAVTVGTTPSFAVTATGVPNTITFTESGPLPAGVTFTSAGTFSGTPAPGSAGRYPITITATNGVSPDATQQFTLTVDPVLTKINWFAAGTGPGVPNDVKVWQADGTLLFDFQPFAAGFTGGVSVALGDVNGDGVPDIIVAAATAGAPQVEVIDGSLASQTANPLLTTTGGPLVNLSAAPTAILASFYAYSTAFTGGVSVAAGRLDGTGTYDVITGAGLGGGPEVKVWAIATGRAALIPSPLADFFALDPNFRGGVTVAAGDIEGLHDGTDDLVVGAASNGAPQVQAYRPTGQEIADFYAAFGGNTGVNVAVGDVEATGVGQFILGAGGGPGSVPQVLVTQYQANQPNAPAQLDSFFAYADGRASGVGVFSGGVTVAASSATSLRDGTGDLLVTGAGKGGGPLVRALNRVAGSEVFGPGGMFAFPDSTSGVFV